MLYNIGQSSKDTGVRYKDVAGVDDIKADITEVMKMVLGDTTYQDMGARPPRVSACRFQRKQHCPPKLHDGRECLLPHTSAQSH